MKRHWWWPFGKRSNRFEILSDTESEELYAEAETLKTELNSLVADFKERKKITPARKILNLGEEVEHIEKTYAKHWFKSNKEREAERMRDRISALKSTVKRLDEQIKHKTQDDLLPEYSFGEGALEETITVKNLRKEMRMNRDAEKDKDNLVSAKRLLDELEVRAQELLQD